MTRPIGKDTRDTRIQQLRREVENLKRRGLAPDSTDNIGYDGVRSETPSGVAEPAFYALTADGAGGSIWAPAAGNGVGGSGGPMQYSGESSLTSYVTSLGATAFWRMGTGPTGTVLDESGYTTLASLTLQTDSAASQGTYGAPTVAANPGVTNPSADGGVSLNCDGQTGYFGTHKYTQFVMSGSSSPVLAKVSIPTSGAGSGKLSGMCYFQGYQTSGTDPTHTPNYWSQIMGFHNTYDGGSTYNGLGLLFNHYTGTLFIGTGLGGIGISVGLAFSTWYHVAFTYDNLVLKLYVNGVKVGTVNTVSTPAANASYFRIGNGFFDFGVTDRNGPFYGAVDEIAFFAGRALTQSEIFGAKLVATVDATTGFYAGELNGALALQDGSVTLAKLEDGTADYVIKMGTTEAEWALVANANVSPTAAIAYTKLNLATSILNADIAAAAAIEHHKLKLGPVSKTANYTATATDDLILCSAATGALTITLPAASANNGRVYTVIKTDASANAVIVDAAGAETINGALTVALATQYGVAQIVSDGSNWYSVGSGGSSVAHIYSQKGAWSGAVGYVIDDVVDYLGSSYVCILGHSNQAPPNLGYWTLVANKGDTGSTGATGSTGPTGSSAVVYSMVAQWFGQEISTGALGIIYRVPYLAGGASGTFDVARISIHLETQGTGSTSVKVQKCSSGTSFASATDIGEVTVAGFTNDADNTTTGLGTVESGDMLRINFTAVAGGAATYTVEMEATQV